MAKAACPTCNKPLASPEARPPFPFCSERCRAIDLGRWLGEEFRIPLRHDEEDEDGARPPRRPLDA